MVKLHCVTTAIIITNGTFATHSSDHALFSITSPLFDVIRILTHKYLKLQFEVFIIRVKNVWWYWLPA